MTRAPNWGPFSFIHFPVYDGSLPNDGDELILAFTVIIHPDETEAVLPEVTLAAVGGVLEHRLLGISHPAGGRDDVLLPLGVTPVLRLSHVCVAENQIALILAVGLGNRVLPGLPLIVSERELPDLAELLILVGLDTPTGDTQQALEVEEIQQPRSILRDIPNPTVLVVVTPSDMRRLQLIQDLIGVVQLLPGAGEFD